MGFTALACLDTLLDVALEPGWNSDYESFENRRKEVEQLLSLIESDQVTIYVPPFLVSLAHMDVKHCFGVEQARRVVNKILEISSSHLRIDDEHILDRANGAIHFPGDTDLYDVMCLVCGQELHVDAILTRHPLVLYHLAAQNKKALSNFDVRILNVGAFINLVSEARPAIASYDHVIFTLTPNNLVIQLPTGSTPIDFAYKIHTRLGDRCIGAKVNGQMVLLDQPLRTGDVVEIIKGSEQSPDPAWLTFIKTKTARKAIHRGIKRIHLKQGWELIRQTLGANVSTYRQKLEHVVEQLNRASLDDLASSIGSREVNIQQVEELIHNCTCYLEGRHHICIHHREPLLTGVGDRTWSIASCCSPLPGDPLVGILNQSRYTLQIHRDDCSNIQTLTSEQRSAISWHHSRWNVNLQITMVDYPDTIRPILNEFAENSITPDLHSLNTSPDGIASASINIMVNPRHPLRETLEYIKTMPRVREVKIKRLTPLIANRSSKKNTR